MPLRFAESRYMAIREESPNQSGFIVSARANAKGRRQTSNPWLIERDPYCQVSPHSVPGNNKECHCHNNQCWLLRPPLAAETPITICVPPSNWISLFAPSRMLETAAMLGSCCPGALFASSTPGIAPPVQSHWITASGFGTSLALTAEVEQGAHFEDGSSAGNLSRIW